MENSPAGIGRSLQRQEGQGKGLVKERVVRKDGSKDHVELSCVSRLASRERTEPQFQKGADCEKRAGRSVHLLPHFFRLMHAHSSCQNLKKGIHFFDRQGWGFELEQASVLIKPSENVPV